MIQSDEHCLSIVDAFQAAALGEQSWDNALQQLADATGSRSAQLASVQADAGVAFNTITNIDPAIYPRFAETTSINPRVPVAWQAPLLEVLSDWDFITPQEYARDRYAQEVLAPFDIPYVCITTLERNAQAFVALCVIRSRHEGDISPEQRRLFAVIAPHVRSAVRTHVALQGHGIAVFSQAMEALSISAFVCDGTGRVVTLTQCAEALVRSGCGLHVQAGRLHATEPSENRMLEEAIAAAAAIRERPGAPASRTVIVRSKEKDLAPVVVDIFPCPSRSRSPGLTGMAPRRVLVVIRGARDADARRVAVLSGAYGLTPAEAEIAVHLAEGKSPGVIAARRGVAVGTVRAQTKTILAKLGLRRQLELAARINQL